MRVPLRDWIGNGKFYGWVRYARMAWRRWWHGWHHVDPLAWVHASADIRPDLVAGPYAFVSFGCLIMRDVEIGRYSMLAPRVAIIGVDHAYDIPGTPMFFTPRPSPRSTVVEDDVWIGFGTVIMQGVHIGRGSVVAARSVVTKDIPPYEIWAGIPARKIKERFPDPVDRRTHDNMLNGSLVVPRWPRPL